MILLREGTGASFQTHLAMKSIWTTKGAIHVILSFQATGENHRSVV